MVLLWAMHMDAVLIIPLQAQTRAGVPGEKFTWFNHAVFLEWMPGVLTRVEIGVMLLSIVCIAVWRTVPYYRERTQRDFEWGHMLEFWVGSTRIAGTVYVVYLHGLYWVSWIYEIAVFSKGKEMDVWGSEGCKWYDPWSDTLFIY